LSGGVSDLCKRTLIRLSRVESPRREAKTALKVSASFGANFPISAAAGSGNYRFARFRTGHCSLPAVLSEFSPISAAMVLKSNHPCVPPKFIFLEKSVRRSPESFRKVLSAGCVPKKLWFEPSSRAGTG
jgi:hypothetical protein